MFPTAPHAANADIPAGIARAIMNTVIAIAPAVV